MMDRTTPATMDRTNLIKNRTMVLSSKSNYILNGLESIIQDGFPFTANTIGELNEE